jgi:hypothetical protein
MDYHLGAHLIFQGDDVIYGGKSGWGGENLKQRRQMEVGVGGI